MRLACPGLFSLVRKNVTVVAPSRLLAAVAYQQFAAHQLQQRKESWLRPSVMSLGAWLTRSWQEVRYIRSGVPTLLSPSQEHLLWTQIISAEQPDLFDLDATAQMASRSARLLAEWSTANEVAEWSAFSGVHHFQSWVKLFRQRCSKEGWITRADLWERLPDWIPQTACAAERVVFLLSGPPVPSMRKLIQAIEGRASIELLGHTRPASAVSADHSSTHTMSSNLPPVGRALLLKRTLRKRSPCSFPGCRHAGRKSIAPLPPRSIAEAAGPWLIAACK